MKRKRHTQRRGRTRSGRLDLANRLLKFRPLLPNHQKLTVVDVGYGDSMVSTFELARVVSKLAPEVEVIGVEQEPGRVEQARREIQALDDEDVIKPLTMAIQGGFSLSQSGIETAHFIRCFNVLRGYGLEQTTAALRTLSSHLANDGLLMEGTSDTEGHLLSCHLWKKRGARLNYGGLFFATDFSRGFSPKMFRDVLPRDLRRHFVAGEPVYQLLMAWDDAVTRLRNASPRGHRSTGRHDEKRLCLRSLTQLHEETAAVFQHPLEAIDLSPDHLIDGPAQGVLWTPFQPSQRDDVMCPDPSGEVSNSRVFV